MDTYLVSAVSNDNMHVVSVADDGLPDKAIADWAPSKLILYKGRKKFDADFWDFDTDRAWLVSERVAEALRGAQWCRLQSLSCEAVDAKGKPCGLIVKTLVHFTRTVDALDAEKTRFKAYGHRIVDLDTPGGLVLNPARVPSEGVFRQPSGSSDLLLAVASFKDQVEGSGWTGLTFKAL